MNVLDACPCPRRVAGFDTCRRRHAEMNDCLFLRFASVRVNHLRMVQRWKTAILFRRRLLPYGGRSRVQRVYRRGPAWAGYRAGQNVPRDRRRGNRPRGGKLMGGATPSVTIQMIAATTG